MEDDFKKIGPKTTGCLSLLFCLAGVLTLGAFTVMYMFNNLIAPTFDLIRINLVQAFGIDLFISYLTFKESNSKEGDEVKRLTNVAMVTVMFLVMAWAAVQFM